MKTLGLNNIAETNLMKGRTCNPLEMPIDSTIQEELLDKKLITKLMDSWFKN
jgi:hypothetical protein